MNLFIQSPIVFICDHRTSFYGGQLVRLRRDGRGLEVQGVQLLDAASADGHRGVGQSHGGSPPGPPRTAAGGVVLRPLVAGQGGAATGPEADGLGHTQLAVVDLVRELVVLSGDGGGQRSSHVNTDVFSERKKCVTCFMLCVV